MSALDKQEGGSHYKDMHIQPIEYITKNKLDWYQGNIVKYATRHHDKGGAADLRKVIHYAELALEAQYGTGAIDATFTPAGATTPAPAWIYWSGAAWCPVPESSTKVHVRFRNGVEVVREAYTFVWHHRAGVHCHTDIIAYRIAE